MGDAHNLDPRSATKKEYKRMKGHTRESRHVRSGMLVRDFGNWHLRRRGQAGPWGNEKSPPPSIPGNDTGAMSKAGQSLIGIRCVATCRKSEWARSCSLQNKE